MPTTSLIGMFLCYADKPVFAQPIIVHIKNFTKPEAISFQIIRRR